MVVKIISLVRLEHVLIFSPHAGEIQAQETKEICTEGTFEASFCSEVMFGFLYLIYSHCYESSVLVLLHASECSYQYLRFSFMPSELPVSFDASLITQP